MEYLLENGKAGIPAQNGMLIWFSLRLLNAIIALLQKSIQQSTLTKPLPANLMNLGQVIPTPTKDRSIKFAHNIISYCSADANFVSTIFDATNLVGVIPLPNTVSCCAILPLKCRWLDKILGSKSLAQDPIKLAASFDII
jgi:hypothetical protein